MKVRYLDIVVSDNATARGGRARIPANRVDLEPDQRRVVTDRTRAELPAFLGNAADTTEASAYQESAVGGETAATAETSIRSAAAAAMPARTERITRSEEELRVGTRPVQAGEVVVGKHVETERVTTPVQRRVEHVRVERRPVTDGTGQAELSEGEIRVPVMEEEVVVEKRPVVKEEIVITREATTETEQVESDVRRERVDISGDEDSWRAQPPRAGSEPEEAAVADIDVVKSKSSNWVWWVLAAVVVMLALVFMMRGRRDNAPAGSSSSANAPASSLLVRIA